MFRSRSQQRLKIRNPWINLCYDLELSKPIFHKTLWLVIMYHHTKFWLQIQQQFRKYCGKVILCHSDLDHENTLTLKIPKQSSAWHLGSLWCITMPCLVTKGIAFQKISYWQTSFQKISYWQTFIEIMDLHCDLELYSQFFFQKPYVKLPSHQQSRRYREETCDFNISRYCDLKQNNFLLHITLAPSDAPPYQVWLQKAE